MSLTPHDPRHSPTGAPAASAEGAGAPGEEIEITPEMIAAGCDALTLMGDAQPAAVVWEIYRAMTAAMGETPSASAQQGEVEIHRLDEVPY